MEDARIVESQQRAEAGVVLVTGAADRVEAAARALQLARGDVERAALELALEQRNRFARRQATAFAQRSVAIPRRDVGRRFGEIGVEIGFDDDYAVGAHWVLERGI